MEELMKIAEALGLPPEATLEAILEAIAALKPAPVEDAPEAERQSEGEDEKTKMASQVARALADRVRVLEQERDSRDRADLVRAHRAAFASPALEAWALTQPLDVLRSFVAAAPAAPRSQVQPRGATAPQASDLSEAELTYCRSVRRDPKEFAAAKARFAGRRRDEEI